MNEMTPIQALIDAAEEAANNDSVGVHPATQCVHIPKFRLENLRLAIPAAKLYPERIEFLEAALRESTYYIPEDGVCSRTHPAYYRWLGEKENAEVGESAGGGTTSPDAIREAKREAWEEGRGNRHVSALLAHIEELETALEEAIPFAQAYAASNPVHMWDGRQQDPHGVHEWLKSREKEQASDSRTTRGTVSPGHNAEDD